MNDVDLLKKIFEGTPVTNDDYWLEQCSDQESVPMTMLFTREVWKGVLAPGATDWIDKTIQSLEDRIGREDRYAKRFQPEKPELLAALNHVKESNVDPAAVAHIVRESQTGLLDWIFSLLDGGHTFEEPLESNWDLFELDDDLKPTRPFMMFSGAAQEFGPAPSDQV